MTTATTAAPASAAIPRTTPAPDSRPIARLRVTGAELTRLVGAVLPFADDPDTAAFPLLANVQLLVHHDSAGAWLYVAATNRYCLGVARVRLDEDTDPMPAGTTWDVTVSARELSRSVTGIPAKTTVELDLVLDPDGVAIIPAGGGLQRYLSGTGLGFPQWPGLLLNTTTGAAAATPTSAHRAHVLTPRFLALLAPAMRNAGHDDVARMWLLTQQHTGAPSLLMTLAPSQNDHESSHPAPWFTGLIAGRLPSTDHATEATDATDLETGVWPELADLHHLTPPRPANGGQPDPGVVA